MVEQVTHRCALAGLFIGPADSRKVPRRGDLVLERVAVDSVCVEESCSESNPVGVGLDLVDNLGDALLHVHDDFAGSEWVGSQALDRSTPGPVVFLRLVHCIEEGVLTAQDQFAALRIPGGQFLG